MAVIKKNAIVPYIRFIFTTLAGFWYAISEVHLPGVPTLDVMHSSGLLGPAI
jgi:hypothetical protein